MALQVVEIHLIVKSLNAYEKSDLSPLMGSFASHEVNEFATSDISLFPSSRNIKECE